MTAEFLRIVRVSADARRLADRAGETLAKPRRIEQVRAIECLGKPRDDLHGHIDLREFGLQAGCDFGVSANAIEALRDFNGQHRQHDRLADAGWVEEHEVVRFVGLGREAGAKFGTIGEWGA